MSNTRDADLYTELLVRAATGESEHHMKRLNGYEQHMVRANRIIYTRLMLGLAVKLEAGVKPVLQERNG